MLGLVAGLALAVAGPRLLDRDDAAEVGAGVPLSAPTSAARGEQDRGGAPAPPGADVDSAEAAVIGFLTAEAAGDLEASFGFLSAADRQRYGSPAGWVSVHADVLPPVLGFEVEEARADEVVTVVDFEPGLDQVTGLTPGRARITWRVDADASDLGVSLDESQVEALHPPDAGAVAAAEGWAGDRQACREPAAERPGLIGSPALADALCDASGTLSVGEPEPLGDVRASSVATAFGAEAASAARLVRIGGPVELGAVLVPIGDEWNVIGVVP